MDNIQPLLQKYDRVNKAFRNIEIYFKNKDFETSDYLFQNLKSYLKSNNYDHEQISYFETLYKKVKNIYLQS